jgi:dihydrofolate reductase
VKVSVIAAVARNGVIGRDNAIPWRIPEDLARFRELTTGHAVVMGRRTWDSLPERFRPLPARRNVVVTRDPDWRADGAERAGSLGDALALLEGAQQVFVIGGGQLYAEALPLADELRLTEIDAEVEGDVLFPPWERASFDEVSREEHVSETGLPFAFVCYRERSTAEPLDAGYPTPVPDA